ncbi:phage repressor protein C with HTH and peptisase S24 domain [Paucimonas lemoignei]|uniref:Phage repressor protein C with HTH and peptisase S24 domain n=1 Tax=Paucimonas lemoignei TaxID=29443 RepID=A0A4R3I013_PAULE|nr:S24 family peptidase [Paucimonas lemoignei]TCS38504.1 phage repressor protein C with HTH and peptisase S24 domain [Paucimonas lemoignei]
MKNENKFEEVISRAKIALKVNGDKELAALLEMSATAFSNRKKKGSIPYEKLTELLASRNVDFRWVFTGSVDSSTLRDATMAATDVALRYSTVGRGLMQEMQEAAFVEKLTADQLLDRFRDRLPETFSVDTEVAQENAEHYRMSDYQLVPRTSARPSAGHGMIVESDQIVDYLAFKREWLSRVLGITHGDIALVQVRGSSMATTVYDGDLVLVDMRQNRLDASAIYVLKIGEALLLKRVLINLDGSVTIKSDNEEYGKNTYSAEQLRELNLQILGRVVWPRLR